MMPVKFSIVTPSFNQAGFIERTLNSVQGQQADFGVEHIVIDGGSTDGTLEILEKYSGRIRYFSGPDRGMADALNKGFGMASGNIIGWLNSDDLYLPGTLQKTAEYFEQHPGCLWLYGNCRIIDEDDHEIRRWITAYKNRLARNFSYERLLVENFISQPAVFMRREALEAAGQVDTTLPTAMDYDLWLRLAKLGKPGYLSDDLACFRVHKGSISARSYRAQFAEQYSIHLRYDRRLKYRLLHRMHVMKTIGSYWMLNQAGKLF